MQPVFSDTSASGSPVSVTLSIAPTLTVGIGQNYPAPAEFLKLAGPACELRICRARVQNADSLTAWCHGQAVTVEYHSDRAGRCRGLPVAAADEQRDDDDRERQPQQPRGGAVTNFPGPVLMPLWRRSHVEALHGFLVLVNAEMDSRFHTPDCKIHAIRILAASCDRPARSPYALLIAQQSVTFLVGCWLGNDGPQARQPACPVAAPAFLSVGNHQQHQQ